MNNQELCPVCREGHLAHEVNVVSLHFSGVSIDALQHIHACEVCGIETATAEDLRFNARSARNAEQKANGRMTGDAIRSLRTSLKITQEVAGQIFGGGPIAFCKYEKNDLTPTDAMDNLLWLIQQFPSLATYLADRKKIVITPTVIASDIKVGHVSTMPMERTQVPSFAATISNAIANSHRVWTYGIPLMTMPGSASNDTTAYAQAS